MQATANGSQVFVALSTVVVLLVGIGFSASFGLTFAGLIVFAGMVPTMFGAAQRVMGAYTTYQSVAPNAASTYELLDTRPSVRESADAVALGDVHGNLVFEDVTFGYTPDQIVLDGLSFSIAEGETVALVGGIGSGKSTVFNLLLRFLDPQRGRILLDGHDIAGVTIASLRDQVSKLAQFPFFTKDTIRENIRLARPDASDADVEEACKQAHVHSVITDPTKLHDGYDTVVDVQVPSGGQKRLIALARCLLRKPEVLLLDEPTENLDADQRARLTGVIRDYARDRTCVVISHDMDFIAAVADRILVLEHGRIAQVGDHHALMAEGGLYKRLYEAQNVDPDLVYPTPSDKDAQAGRRLGRRAMNGPCRGSAGSLTRALACWPSPAVPTGRWSSAAKGLSKFGSADVARRRGLPTHRQERADLRRAPRGALDSPNVRVVSDNSCRRRATTLYAR